MEHTERLVDTAFDMSAEIERQQEIILHLRDLLGRGVVLAIQTNDTDLREWAAGIPITFINGSPHALSPN